MKTTTEQQIEAQQRLIASRVDDGTYEEPGSGYLLKQADQASLDLLEGQQAQTQIHVGRYYDEQAVDVSGIARDEHDAGFVVVKARTEKQAVDVFVDVDKARDLRKALDRAIRAADPWATRQANFKRRQAKWAKRDAEFRERQIAAGRMNPDGTWKD